LNVSLPGIDRETAQKLVDGAEVVAGDLLELADVYRVVTGLLAGLLRHVHIRRLPGSDRDHGGGRLGIWSQRSGQHIANDSFPDEPEHHAEPQQRPHWLGVSVCLIHQ
jgi:hypothetical protein